MSEIVDMPVNPTALVLWSGGKDSMLAACSLLREGKDVVLLSINGGSLIAERYLLHGYRRLHNRFGDRVSYAGIYCTASWVHELGEWFTMSELGEISASYPHLSWGQVRCLHCQTSMWLAAIAYARAKGIDSIAAGYKGTDSFCTGAVEYVDVIRSIADIYDVKVETPCWSITSDFERDMKMMDSLLHPSVFEPQCMAGTPARALDPISTSDMMRYFDDHLRDTLRRGIEHATEIFAHIKLGEESFDLYDVDALNCRY